MAQSCASETFARPPGHAREDGPRPTAMLDRLGRLRRLPARPSCNNLLPPIRAMAVGDCRVLPSPRR